MSTRFDLLITVLASPLVALSGSAQAQSSPSLFPDPMAIPYSYGHPVCNAFATGDFDGDGFVDIAALTTSQFFVYRGHARDGFCSPAQNWLPGVANRVESGDMNGDGWTDLVFTLDAGNVLVLIANTHGSFDALPQVAVGTQPRELVLGDLDADGDLDVVVGNYGQGTLTFCRNDGSGALTPYHTESLPARPASLAIGRLDGDTSLDIAVGCFDPWSSELRVLFNDGTGLFPTMTSLFVGGNMDEIEIADFNGDTKQDLSWRSYPILYGANYLQISDGDGAGHFATPVTLNFPLDNWYLWTTHGDLDNDGDQDLVVSDAFSVFYVMRNDGGGVFTKLTEASVSYSKEGRPVDVDADGKLDLIVGGDNIQVLFGDGQAGFTPTPTQILLRQPGTQLAHADLDADGNQDEIVGSGSNQSGNLYVTVCFGDGQGSISALQDVSLATNGTRANPAVTDWNGDTQPDVVVATSVGVSVFYNNGGVLTPFSTVDPGAGNRRIEGADFDRDGFGDFLVANEYLRTHTLYHSDGVGGFTIRHTWTYVGNPESTAIGDLNGDTFADFVIGTVGSVNSGTIYVWESHGASYVPASSFTVNAGVWSLSIGDVDGDGDLDLSSRLNAGGFVYLNDGAGNLSQSAFLNMDPFAEETHVVDMDGDGDGDVVSFDSTSNRCATVFRSFGTGSFLPGASYFIGGQNRGDIVDMNNDGRPDLVAVYSDRAANATALRVMLQSHPPVTVYCSPKVNSLGCVPEITYSGVPSASNGSGFVIGAHRILANKSGLFFYGHSGPNAAAFQAGTMCVKAPTVRLPIQTSGGSGSCTGSFATDFNVRIASGVDSALVVGERVCGQWWSRDTGFAPPNTTSLTNAIEFVIQQ